MTAVKKIEFQNVSKKYGTIDVVGGVSFKIFEGDFVSLLGPSGCGKTTIMNMLAGFLKPSEGKVLIEEEMVEGPGSNRGVIFQDYGIFPWLNVEKNIRFGLDLSVKSKMNQDAKNTIVERYIRLMQLSDFRTAWPKNLSGGMKQRLALARAYATNPQYLLMDEPFGALDAQTRSKMHDLILAIMQAEKKTALLITHSVDESLYLSNRVIIISSRPSKIIEEIEIPFKFPREKNILDSREFIRLRKHLRDLVMKQYEKQQALEINI